MNIRRFVFVCFRSKRYLRRRWSSIFWKLVIGTGSSTSISFGFDCYIGNPENVKIGNNVVVEDNVFITSELTDSTMVMEENVLVSAGCRLDHTGCLELKKNVLLSKNVSILTHTHGFQPKSLAVPTPLVVEEGAWIGLNSIIMSGVKIIGKGSIVAAGSVVVKTIGDYEVWGGVPATFIKNVGTEERKNET